MSAIKAEPGCGCCPCCAQIDGRVCEHYAARLTTMRKRLDAVRRGSDLMDRRKAIRAAR